MRLLRWLGVIFLMVISFYVGTAVSTTEFGEAVREAGDKATRAATETVATQVGLDTRQLVLIEHPRVIQAVRRGGGFGGRFSQLVAQNMFSRKEEVIEEARELTEIEEIAPRTWLIRMPIVNAVLFETDEGLVLVDTGMAPAGPAIMDAIRSVSDAPIHTIIYTHGHVDHAYGTWAILEAGETPEIIAHEDLLPRFERYLRLRGSIARYMSQPEHTLPKSRDDFVWPTRTFRDELELEIGGETFVLTHDRGETDDQLWVWVPGRKAIATADYYQGFLPNAGNGKRVQRHPEEWAQALRAMAALKPELVLPAHGEALTDPAQIQKELTILADALDYITAMTIDGLNTGLRQDQIPATIELPPELANEHSLREQYVSVQDVSKMVIKQYTGWWNDIPSNWTPAPMEAQGREIVALAGGMPNLIARARDAMTRDMRLASHLADWAFLADPDDPEVQELVIDVYEERIVDEESNTQEMLAYIDAMTAARDAQLRAELD